MPHTNYVSTRWYRAPEIIFRSRDYDEKADMFALGCIFAELYTGDPLMPGSNESDQLMRMSKLIGQPPSNWGLAKSKILQYPHGTMLDASLDQVQGILRNAIPQASGAAI